ncbi:PASTA domain-containing protein [Flavobacterium salilacus subsp. salilacus]|uniref:PASTA domain-containing protein n=1 Tax=Flavobacterium TaxID=237 RepID=UPI001075289E|nr:MULTISPECIES: PASTA domain-containing protein [Flavobacterium]KAF2519093.1 PASTA domain-containing protein [Flavobacterium salilacus subsp. salilacus]MBE1613270.1 PASTA domain-containing protein [Flavobacterium sp. SaA2.13]
MSLKNFVTSKTFAIQLAIALGIIIITVYAALKWLQNTTNHGQEIPVPNLAKMSVEKAGQSLEAINLQYVVLDTMDFNKDYPPYSIVQQDPLPNVNVKENRKIYLKVNAGGYNDIRLPDLIQKTYRQVVPNLKSAGLQEGKKTYKPYLAKDVVLEMWQNGKKLKAGDMVKKASKIDLVLGDGKTGYEEDSEMEDSDIEETDVNGADEEENKTN